MKRATDKMEHNRRKGDRGTQGIQGLQGVQGIQGSASEEFGLRDFLTEKFEDNKSDHIKIWQQVSVTNGRVRLLERAMWAVGGGVVVMALLFSPQAVSAIIGLLK
jgi:hypothetical protein